MAINLGSDNYEAITMAINSTGAQGVADLEANVNRLKAAMVAQQAALAAGGPVNQKAIADLAALRGELQRAEEAYAAAARVLAGKSADAGRSVRGLGQAIQEFGRGAQDITLGGIIGGVNNLSRITEGLASAMKLTTPQIQMVGAATDVAASLALVLYQNWGKVKAFFDDGLGPKLLTDLKEVNKQLKELHDRPNKSLVDLQDIAILEKVSEKLTEVQAAIKAMKGPSSEVKERGQAVQNAVKEEGGFDAVAKSLTDIRAGQEKPEVKEAREKIARIEADIQAAQKRGAQFEELSYLDAQLQAVKKTKEGQQSIDRQNQKVAIDELIGMAGKGDKASIEELIRQYDANKGIFDRNQVTPDFRAELKKSLTAPTKKEAKAAEAARREVEADIAAAGEQAGREIRDGIASVKAGIFEQLADELQKNIRAGLTVDAARTQARGGLFAYVKGRAEVVPTARSAVADELLNLAGDEAQNREDSGQKSRLEVKQDAAKAKADTDREQAVNEQVKRVQGQFEAAVMRAINRRFAQGQDSAQIAPAMAGQIQGLLGGRNVPANLQADVAKKIAEGLTNKAVNREDKDAAQAIKPMLPEIEAYITQKIMERNRLGPNAPQARSAREHEEFQGTGIEHGLSDAAIRDIITRDTTERLRRAGRDVRLADDAFEQGWAAAEQKFAAAQMGTQTYAQGVNNFVGAQTPQANRRKPARPPQGRQQRAGAGFQSVAPEEPEAPSVGKSQAVPASALVPTLDRMGRQQDQALGMVQALVARFEADAKRRDHQLAMIYSGMQRMGNRMRNSEWTGPSLLAR